MSKQKIVSYNYHQKNTKEYTSEYYKTDNFSIKSNYFVKFSKKENERGPAKLDDEWVTSIKRFDKFFILEEIKRNFTSLLADISSHKPVKFFSAATDSRLLVGLGNAHIKETYLNLHYIYGVPYIPGSSIKGICRHYVISEILDRFGDNLNCIENLILLDIESFLHSKSIEADLEQKTRHEEKIDKEKRIHTLKSETLKKAVEYVSIMAARLKAEKQEEKLSAEEETLLEKEINWKELDLARLIFGNNDQAGDIVFYDAFSQSCQIELDIMNPHYGKYYGDESGKEMPVDYDNPVPIKFAAIGSGAIFRFALTNRDYASNDELLLLAKEWLQRALENHGIGAKTAVGYGFFKDFKDLSAEFITLKEEKLPEKDRLLLNIQKKDIQAIEEAINNRKTGELDPDQGQEIVTALENLFSGENNYVFENRHILLNFCNLAFDFISLPEVKLSDPGSRDKIIQQLKKYGSKKLQEKLGKEDKLASLTGDFKGTDREREILTQLVTAPSTGSLKNAYEHLSNLSPGEPLEGPKIIAEKMKTIFEQPGRRLKKELKKMGDSNKYLQKIKEIMNKK